MSKLAALLLVAAAWLVASPAASARPGASVLAERPSPMHGIAGDRRYVFVTEPGIGDGRPGSDVAEGARPEGSLPPRVQGPAAGGPRVVVLDRFSGRELATLPAPAGGFKFPFTLRVPSPGHLVVLDNAGFPPQGAPKVYDYAYRTDRRGFRAAVTRTVDFSGLPLAFAEDVEVLPDGQYVVSESVIGGLWLIGRDGAVRPGLVPSGPAPLQKLGGCLFPAGSFSVGGIAFAPIGGFAPGVGSLALRGDDLYLSSTCEGGVMKLPVALLEDGSRPAEDRVGAIQTVVPRAFSLESLKGIQFDRFDPRDPWLYGGDPFRLQLIRVDVRTGRREVLSRDERLFDFTVSTAFLPPLLPWLPSPLVTASDQEYRSTLLNAALTADAFRAPFVVARYHPR
jgi:hypothetical protein